MKEKRYIFVVFLLGLSIVFLRCATQKPLPLDKTLISGPVHLDSVLIQMVEGTYPSDSVGIQVFLKFFRNNIDTIVEKFLESEGIELGSSAFKFAISDESNIQVQRKEFPALRDRIVAVKQYFWSAENLSNPSADIYVTIGDGSREPFVLVTVRMSSKKPKQGYMMDKVIGLGSSTLNDLKP